MECGVERMPGTRQSWAYSVEELENLVAMNETARIVTGVEEERQLKSGRSQEASHCLQNAGHVDQIR